jgi:hypothetical protein
MTLCMHIYIYIIKDLIKKCQLLLNVNSMTWYCHTLKIGNVTIVLMSG